MYVWNIFKLSLKLLFFTETFGCFLSRRTAVERNRGWLWLRRFGQRAISSDELQSNRTGRNRWSLANIGWTMFETARVSLAAQQPKISKTLLCWFIHTCLYWQVFLEENNVSLDPILSSVQQAVLMGGKWDWLLFELSAVETAGLGREEEEHCYLNAAGRKNWQRNRKHGAGTAVIDWKMFLCPAQVHRKKKKTTTKFIIIIIMIIMIIIIMPI